jgi:hypothetical protein
MARVILIIFLLPNFLFAIPSDTLIQRKIKIRAVRLQEQVTVDGILSESVWQNEFGISEFIQKDPIENAQPSQKTIVRIVYDDEAIYVGARMYDSRPDSIIGRLGRRDAQINSDLFGLGIDSYYDRRGGFYFALNAAGTMYDGVMYNDDWSDDSWDGVWEGKVNIDSIGWTAEMKIPFSQLRFHTKDNYVWGIDFERDIARKNEKDYIVFTPKNGSGFVSRFVDLVGIEKITPPRRIELLPYSTAQAKYLRHAAGDPFNNGSTYMPGLGADVKVGLGSNLTLDATINPDFGQVEVDPAVVNLSDMETYYNEKRPFFIEGASIFNFGYGGANNNWSFNWGNPDFFYSRRIGRSPQGSIPEADFVDLPVGVHIIGAGKLTGKVGDNWNLGTFSAITNREYANLQKSSQRFEAEIEPLTYYGVFRAQKDMNEGRQGLGVISTITARSFKEDRLRDEFNRNSFALGFDGWTFLDSSKTWVINGWAGLSNIMASKEHIISLQCNSLHYFQRPDFGYIQVDSSRTSLTGYAARIALNKQKGNTFVNAAIGIIDPKFDVNDIGFQWCANIINGHFVFGYKWTEPNAITRTINLNAAIFRSYDFDKNMILSGYFLNYYMQLLNYYSISYSFAYNPQTVNNRGTRGGPLMLNLSGWGSDFYLNSDDRKPIYFGLGFHGSNYNPSWYWSVYTSINWNPSTNISLSFSPGLDKNHEDAQWVNVFDSPFATSTYGKRYVFANMDQTTLSASIRINWTFTPKLSLQIYIQPLISSGNYYNFKELAYPKSYTFNEYGMGNSTYSYITRKADPDGPGPAEPINLGNPCFNYKSLRGNAVLRWEYLPGSTFYLVWTQSRSDSESIGEFMFDHSFNRLWRTSPDNIFMIKVTYWMNI